MVASHVKGVRDVEVALEIHDVERGKAWRKVRIHEAARNGRRLETVVEHLDLAVEEICGKQAKIHCAVTGDGDALVDAIGDRGGRYGDCGGAAASFPRGNDPVLRGPKERRSRGSSACGTDDLKVGRGRVERYAGRRAPGDRYDQWLRRSAREQRIPVAVVDRRHAGCVVRNPNRVRRAEHDAPAVLEIDILVIGHARQVRNEIVNDVVAGIGDDRCAHRQPESERSESERASREGKS